MRSLRSRKLSVESLEHRLLLTAVCSSGRDVFTVGLVSCTSEASDGYTLVPQQDTSHAYLVDIHGRTVHEWTGGPYEARRGVYVGENGHLYSTGVVANPAQNAGGVTGAIYVQDWDGNLVWQYEYATADYTLHHDLEVLPNGNILAFAWTAHATADLIALGRDPTNIPSGGLWGERIIELEITGPTTADIVWEWNLIDHVVQDFDNTKPNFGVIADHPERFDINLGGANEDWVHINTIDYNPQLDQIVVSSPFMNEIWVIDHSTTTAEAATSSGGNSGKGGDFLYRWGNPSNYGAPGPQQLFFQHDIQWIEQGKPGAGNFIVFNNRTTPNATLVEFAPPVDSNGNYSITPGQAYGPTTPIWNVDTGEVATFISGVQRLPNGNTLFIDGPDGFVIEIKPNGDRVWEYVNPVFGNGQGLTRFSQQGNPPSLANIFKTQRYPTDFAGFAGRDLSPTGWLEEWTQGDYDLDQTIDATDMQAFCSGLQTGDRIYDLNFDDLLNLADVEEMVLRAGTLMGDANFDMAVDGRDFIAWNDHKFQADNMWSHGDFNCDGFVDGVDFTIWNDNKFQSVDFAIGVADIETHPRIDLEQNHVYGAQSPALPTHVRMESDDHRRSGAEKEQTELPYVAYLFETWNLN